MKKALLVISFVSFFAISLFAQDDEVEKGFKKQNLFTGGSVTLSFFNNQTVIGANPIFGYKLTNWADAGISLNFLYSGSRDYYEFDDKMKQVVFGPGVFARIYPVKFLFLQGQFEHSFTTLKYIPSPGSVSFTEDKTSTDVNSLLVGGGLATGREKGSTSFYYISLLFDVLKNINSPYVNVSYNPDNPSQQRVSMVPIIRAGMNIGLFQNRYE